MAFKNTWWAKYRTVLEVTRVYDDIEINAYIFFLVFTTRRVCIAWTMPWQDVRPSVCPSHVSIVSKRLGKFSHRRVAPPF